MQYTQEVLTLVKCSSSVDEQGFFSHIVRMFCL